MSMRDILFELVPPLYERGRMFTDYIRALGDEMESFIDGAKTVMVGWTLDNAGTYALDVIGRSVELPRPTWASNDDYRQLIRAMFAALNSNGSYADVSAIIDHLQDVAGSVILPIYPAGIEFDLLGDWLTAERAALAASIVEIGLPAGVGYDAFWSDTKYFAWDGDPHPLAGTWGDPWIRRV